ncbi:MAG: N(G),N(G)-dimethylarginine dimethylaminohydrolase, partial [bacterium]
IEHITPPGTLEGGDVLRAEDHFYIGLSSRTNKAGAEQLIGILKKYGYSGSAVNLKHMLHLKTGIAYVGRGIFLTAGECINHPVFTNQDNILVEDKEAYAANAIAVNGNVLIPSGFPSTRKKIEAAGLPVIELDVSEFQKMDGGLSCLSLRF